MEKYKQRLAEMQADRQGLANTLDEQQEQNKVLKTQVSNDQGDSFPARSPKGMLVIMRELVL